MHNNDKIQISIIIPVYNTPKKFFEKCVESVMNTEYPFFEVIIVDDGSKEENSKEYKLLSERYNRIFFYKKKNGGVSSARNYGISKARGKYIAFVDSDDVVTENFIMDAAALIDKFNSDIIIGTMKYNNIPWFPQGVDKELYLKKENIISLKKCFLEIPQNEIPHKIIGTPCARLYRKEIVENNLFSENFTHSEDQIFNRKIFDLIEDAVLVPNIWYVYNQNDFSAMHQALSGKYMEKLEGFFEVWERMNEEEDDEEIRVGSRVRSIEMFFGAINDIVGQNKIRFFERIRMIEKLYSYKIFSNLEKKLPMRCAISRNDKIKLYLIKKRRIFTMFFLIFTLQKIRHLRGI